MTQPFRNGDGNFDKIAADLVNSGVPAAQISKYLISAGASPMQAQISLARIKPANSGPSLLGGSDNAMRGGTPAVAPTRVSGGSGTFGRTTPAPNYGVGSDRGSLSRTDDWSRASTSRSGGSGQFGEGLGRIGNAIKKGVGGALGSLFRSSVEDQTVGEGVDRAINGLGNGLGSLFKKSTGGITPASANRSAAQPGKVNPTGGSAGGFDMPFPESTFEAPQISARDFSAQANDLAANAYGPLYEAINAGKANAQGQYNTSDQVVKGLYDKLVADTQASGQAQAAQYDQSSAAAAQRAQELQATQGQIFQNTANSQADLMAKLGQQETAGQILGANTDEQNFQQSQAAQQGAAQQNYYGQQKQGALDYNSAIAGANNTAGTVARENLVRDLSGVLAQFDQSELGARSDQARTALDLGNQLSDRDLSVQTANANNSMSAAQMNQQGAQNAWQAQYQAGRDTVQDSQFDRQMQWDQDKFGVQTQLDTAAALAEAQSAAGQSESGLKFNELPPATQVASQAAQLLGTGDPQEAQQYVDFLNSQVSGLEPNDYNLQTFSKMVADMAGQNGLNPGVAYSLAGSYWNRIMNRS